MIRDYSFIDRVCEGIDETDCDPFHAAIGKSLGSPRHLIRRQCDINAAVSQYAFTQFDAQCARYNARRALPVDIIDVRSALRTHLQNVAESKRRDEPRLREFFLQE